MPVITEAQIRAKIDANIRDNTSKYITPARARDVFVSLVDYAVGLTSGGLANGGNTTGGDMTVGALDNFAFGFLTNGIQRAKFNAAGRLLVGTVTDTTTAADLVQVGGDVYGISGGNYYRLNAAAPYLQMNKASVIDGRVYAQASPAIGTYTTGAGFAFKDGASNYAAVFAKYLVSTSGIIESVGASSDAVLHAEGASGFASLVRFKEAGVADRGVMGYAAGSSAYQLRNNAATSFATGTNVFTAFANGRFAWATTTDAAVADTDNGARTFRTGEMIQNSITSPANYNRYRLYNDGVVLGHEFASGGASGGYGGGFAVKTDGTSNTTTPKRTFEIQRTKFRIGNIEDVAASFLNNTIGRMQVYHAPAGGNNDEILNIVNCTPTYPAGLYFHNYTDTARYSTSIISEYIASGGFYDAALSFFTNDNINSLKTDLKRAMTIDHRQRVNIGLCPTVGPAINGTGITFGTGMFHVKSRDATYPTIVAQMATAQTADLLQCWNASSVTIAKVDIAGTMTAKGFASDMVEKTANYTLTNGDGTVLADSTGGNITITLPTTGIPTGRIYVVKKKVAANVVSLAPSAGTIDGVSSVGLTSIYEKAIVQWDGNNWYIIGS